ncbi:AMP-binding protein [Terricaulis sp.]|uniref:AMP-binding protein n=1 Tax=Terricaulis sp. TaxID=2768686 RepID=UPI0037838A5E
MSLAALAANRPGDPAFVVAETGEALSFLDLNDASARLARVLRRDLSLGDRVAILLDNAPSYSIATWACRRAGLRLVPVNWHLTFEEAAYIVDNSDALALITTPRLAEIASGIAAANTRLRLRISDAAAFDAFQSMTALCAGEQAAPLPDETEGVLMFYSSGTTGFPKGILRPLPEAPFGTPTKLEIMMAGRYGFDADTHFYAPAPLYHAAPLAWTMGAQMLGGAAYIPKRFDAEQTLAHIQKYRITHAKFVPTHFVRLLRLPQSVRGNYDLSSLRVVIHSAAPCPPDVKEEIIAWFGPIVHEYYSMSEAGGFTAIDSNEWLAHRGSVGRSLRGKVHILDDDGRELAPGEVGHIHFENAERFDYHKAPEKTEAFFNAAGWSRPGDMGWLDGDDFLYLADRASHMIISGGVNIYPQEVEAALAAHGAVFDAAVIGVPDAEYGEAVKAVVQLQDPADAGPAMEDALIAHCRARLAGFKCPRSVDFVEALPRLPTGKLLKRELRQRYWPDAKKLI